MRLNAMLFSATALATSARGTTLKTRVLRRVRSNTMPTPASSVKVNRCQTRTRSSASAAASANEMATTTSWLAASARLRLKRSATTPDTGASNSIGIARIASTAPSREPECVRSYTTQPSVACCIHWPAVEQNVTTHKRRKSRWRSAANVDARRDKSSGFDLLGTLLPAMVSHPASAIREVAEFSGPFALSLSNGPCERAVLALRLSQDRPLDYARDMLGLRPRSSLDSVASLLRSGRTGLPRPSSFRLRPSVTPSRHPNLVSGHPLLTL